MNTTTTQYHQLYTAWHKLNHVLFGGSLPLPLLTISNPAGNKRTEAYFHGGVWMSGEKTRDEIALIRRYMGADSERAILCSMAHEMCHQWQYHFGKPSRNGYHNQQWADKMAEIGLESIGLNAEGEPTGKMTGQNASHKLLQGGMLSSVVGGMLMDGWKMPLAWCGGDGKKAIPAARKATKYVCVGCGMALSGKPDLSVICGDCRILMSAEIL